MSVEAGAWSERLSGLERLCEATVAAVLAAEAETLSGPPEVSVLLTDDARIRELNRIWRDRDRATNVLSFPALDEDLPPAPPGEPVLLGDVVLAFETVEQEARDEGRPLSDHVAHLLVHGTLHLLGHDHEDPAEAEAMERREAGILAGLGVPDPYGGELAA
ncbi:MAG TPA: rRNA maturation RNase YbeY [Geminicoccaceae bacterium]|nr:rRNA maturation RNase YbeY [Geminicoccus sp.]HMU48697.1 rRNA maturation RNase YbeY [Geminicoccaceae bacterium]